MTEKTGWALGDDAEAQALIEGRDPAESQDEECCPCGKPMSECDDPLGPNMPFGALFAFPSEEQLRALKAERSRDRRLAIAGQLSLALEKMTDVAVIVAEIIQDDQSYDPRED